MNQQQSKRRRCGEKPPPVSGSTCDPLHVGEVSHTSATSSQELGAGHLPDCQQPEQRQESKERKPLKYWGMFNDWWRAEHDRLGRRPAADEIKAWYDAEARHAWPDGAPTLHETKTHAKCLRSLNLVREYFRHYRAGKKRVEASTPGKQKKPESHAESCATNVDEHAHNTQILQADPPSHQHLAASPSADSAVPLSDVSEPRCQHELGPHPMSSMQRGHESDIAQQELSHCLVLAKLQQAAVLEQLAFTTVYQQYQQHASFHVNQDAANHGRAPQRQVLDAIYGQMPSSTSTAGTETLERPPPGQALPDTNGKNMGGMAQGGKAHRQPQALPVTSGQQHLGGTAHSCRASKHGPAAAGTDSWHMGSRAGDRRAHKQTGATSGIDGLGVVGLQQAVRLHSPDRHQSPDDSSKLAMCARAKPAPSVPAQQSRQVMEYSNNCDYPSSQAQLISQGSYWGPSSRILSSPCRVRTQKPDLVSEEAKGGEHDQDCHQSSTYFSGQKSEEHNLAEEAEEDDSDADMDVDVPELMLAGYSKEHLIKLHMKLRRKYKDKSTKLKDMCKELETKLKWYKPEEHGNGSHVPAMASSEVLSLVSTLQHLSHYLHYVPETTSGAASVCATDAPRAKNGPCEAAPAGAAQHAFALSHPMQSASIRHDVDVPIPVKANKRARVNEAYHWPRGPASLNGSAYKIVQVSSPIGLFPERVSRTAGHVGVVVPVAQRWVPPA